MAQKIPSHNALRVASYILKYFEERNIFPTEVEVLFKGGIGIALNTTKHYMDIEIDNEANTVFSISKNRKNIKFIEILIADSIADVAHPLNEIEEVLKGEQHGR